MWALTDFTAANGATRIVPVSNNRSADPIHGEAYESIPLEMPAGSIGIIVGACYHGGGANTTKRDRSAIAVNYCRGAMRQQENIMLAVHPELVGSCYHGSGANRSNMDRPALLNGYVRGTMRRQENFMLGIRHERLMTFPEALQDILEFKHYGVLGAIFGTQPRVEMERDYPNASADDPYSAIRNSFHEERISGDIYV